MKIARQSLTSLLAVGLVLASSQISPGPAFATPPDVIDIREEPFGLNETHLFVLRSSTDNLGLYESLRVETFLVAIDAATGEEEHWLIDRSVRSSEYSEDGEMLGYKVVRDEGLADVNPFAILAERDALPWSAVSLTGWYEVKADFARTPDGGWQASYPSGQVFRIADAALVQKLVGVSDFMSRNVADHPRMASIATRQLFADRTVPLESCEPAAVFNHFALRAPGTELLVRIDCSVRDEVGVTSVVVHLKEDRSVVSGGG